MSQYPSAIPVADGITWVGAFDPTLDDFHGFTLWEGVKGTTYGSYLVQGEKTALVDTVNIDFVDEFLARVSEVVALEDISYLIVNHVEPDHFGGLMAVLEKLPNAEVCCTAAAARTIVDFHGANVPARIVADGDTVDLGGRTLEFLPVPMVHWPDSMFTYVPESKTLLSNDAFGQHIGIPGTIFASEVSWERLLLSADLYYANILMALSNPIKTAIQKVVAKGWSIETIGPSHGLIYRGEEVGRIIAHYQSIIDGSIKDGSVTLVYSTAWHSTELLAHEITKRLRDRGLVVHEFNLNEEPFSKATLALLKSSALIVGAPTMHNGLFYRTAAFLQYISGLRPKLKLAAAFGSFGWSGGATKQARAMLEAMGAPMVEKDLQIKFRPTETDAETIDTWVDGFVAALAGGPVAE